MNEWGYVGVLAIVLLVSELAGLIAARHDREKAMAELRKACAEFRNKARKGRPKMNICPECNRFLGDAGHHPQCSKRGLSPVPQGDTPLTTISA